MRTSNDNKLGWKEVALTLAVFAEFYCFMWLVSV